MEEQKRGNRYGIPNKTDNAKDISRLKWARELNGFSQTTLAETSGVNLSTIRGFECNHRDINMASAITVYKLATALGVRMEELITL